MKHFFPQIIGAICVLTAFFLGYIFAYSQFVSLYQEKIQTPLYIDVRTTKNSISIQEIPENIFLRVNGEIIQSGSIDLKE